ncbi:flavin reductase family protein [Streptomyces sp. NPDC047002]|uniref:flavin reductase family protein n=1 Tax=Streptomyces sp. NPDC047002 TaxID=3155475 RepID=UPI003456F320
MSAEWSYFVNKDPLYVAVVLGPSSDTRRLLTAGDQFSVTFCSEDQAELADFAGSFSTTDIDKTTSELVTFGEPEVTDTPWVKGGLLALECELRDIVPFPVHQMFVGEAVAAHVPPTSGPPLVKHGPMYTLGAPVQRTAVVAAAQYIDDETIRVAATGPAAEVDEWRITLTGRDGEDVDLGTHPSAEYGDFLADLRLPQSARSHDGARVRVERPGAKPGFARLAPRRPA